MKKYRVIVSDDAYLALDQIIHYKIESSQTLSGAIKFREEILGAIKSLDQFPERGKPYKYGLRGIIVMEHLLLYSIDESQQIVLITDIADPRQLAVFRKYYE